METNTYKRLKDKKQDNFPEYLIIHHGGGTDTEPLLDTSHHTANIMESWHLSKGWEGLGYHLVIHEDGEVWKGRPEHYHGSHARGYNTKSIGICLSGNFDAKLPTDEQVEALRKLLLDLSEKYGIPKENIVPHRKFANKTCYGKLLDDDWASSLLIEKEDDQVTKFKKEIADQQVIIDTLIDIIRKWFKK